VTFGPSHVRQQARRLILRLVAAGRDRLPPAVRRRTWWGAATSNTEFVELAYKRITGHPPDPATLASQVTRLEAGTSRPRLLVWIANSQYGAGLLPRLATEAFHGGRVVWTRSLPRARRILDLGGTAIGDDRGALVAMGYPYDFDEVVIIELPPEQRDALYQVPKNNSIETSQGRVTYLYRSMTDLADLADQSFDLICSAQTFEHITVDEGAKVLHDVRRLLKSDGYLALDTPNVAVSHILARQEGTQFINPDHKIEYAHHQMLALFADADLRVWRQCGIGHMPKSVESNQFLFQELLDHSSLYDDIENCYTLAYLVGPA
jgi:SAM-dependent methyltransferase